MLQRANMKKGVDEIAGYWSPVFDLVDEQIILCDGAFRIFRANASFEKMFGAAGESSVGHDCFEVIRRKSIHLARCLYELTTVPRRIKHAEYFDSCLKKRFKVRALSLRCCDDIVRGTVFWVSDITHHKKEDEMLGRKGEPFRAIFDNLKDAIFVESPDGRIIDVNKAACNLLGYAREELLGMTVGDVVPPEIAARLPKFIQERTIREGVYVETEELRKDGVRIPVEVSNTLVEVDGEKRVIAILRDITERVQAREALCRERDRAQNYLDVAGVIMIALNVKGEITLINRKGCELLGYRPAELVGKNWFQGFIPLRVRETLKAEFDRLIEQAVEDEWYFENAVVTSAGAERIISWHNIALRDAEGRIVGALSSGEDVTERKMAEGALRESEAKYAALVEQAKDGVIIMQNGVFAFANRAMQGLSGYGFKDLIGKPVGELIIPMCGSNGENRIVTPRMMENAEVPVLEARLHCKDGSVKEVSASVARVRYRNEPAVMAIIRDVTEQKKVERMKSNLIRDVSHSLKTPVALVRMAYEMCNRGIESQNLDRIRRSQRIAADNILKLQKDLNNILELFTLEGNRNPGAREECSLHEIINEIKREVDYLLNEKAISFETYVSGDAGSIRGIRREIKMLLYNIIENAIKFTVNGKITVTASRNDGAITLNVTDTGKGIDAEDMGRIFEKFYQSSAAVNGTGLGLAICKEIVERHNGTIRACSDGKGQGSRIEICVPVDLGERRETGFGD